MPFQFVTCIGQNTCPINSFGKKLPTANTISTVGKQGPIYITAIKKLRLSESSDDVEDEDDKDTEEPEARNGTLMRAIGAQIMIANV